MSAAVRLIPRRRKYDAPKPPDLSDDEYDRLVANVIRRIDVPIDPGVVQAVVGLTVTATLAELREPSPGA